MYIQVDCERTLISLLIEIKRLAITSERETVYLNLRHKFEIYLEKRPPIFTNHTDDCVATTTGDVVDTCQCHFYAYEYPKILERDCIEEYLKNRPKFKRFITCFFTCRAGD